jgi:hypothetical protein
MLAMPLLLATALTGLPFPDPIFDTGRDHQVAVGEDFTGDGTTDFVTFPLYGSNATLLAGRGGGLFAAPRDLGIALSDVRRAITANLDGNSFPDIVLTTGDGGSQGVLVVLLGQGGGSFLELPAIPLPSDAWGFAMGDLNEDGDTDLAVACRYAGILAVFLGDGTGSFSAGGTFGFGALLNDAVLGDWNGDGHLDAATANLNPGVVHVYAGNGDGTFGTITVLAGVPDPTALLARDVTGDSIVDLVVAGYPCVYFPGARDGSFLSAVALPGIRVDRFESADVTGDGVEDLVGVGLFENSVQSLPVLSGGGFGTLRASAVRQPRGLTVADLDGDGVRDAAVPLTPDGLRILKGTGDGRFGSMPLVFPAAPGSGLIAAADLDRDGLTDVISAFSVYPGPPTISLRYGDAFTTLTGETLIDPGLQYVSNIAGGDFDGDGTGDLAVSGASTFAGVPRVQIHYGSGPRTFFPPVQTNIVALAFWVGSVDGDAKDDVVALARNNRFSVYRGKKNRTFVRSDRQTISTYWQGDTHDVAFEDVTGDGLPDLSITSFEGDDVQIFAGNGRGVFAAKPAFFPGGTRPGHVAVADMDSDGRNDLVISYRYSSAQVLFGEGGGSFALDVADTLWFVDEHDDLNSASWLEIQDFDLDGLPDIMLGGVNAGIYAGRASRTLATRVRFDAGNALLARSGDFNGDGARDLVAITGNPPQIQLTLNLLGAP